ncbi:MAG: DUF502 domain-containing protein [Phycisphaerae bacterium]|nr:DUF502 domain-containing protein [Phycisphaerae bacterium]
MAATNFKRSFFRGLAAILPTVLTLALIVWVFSKIQDYFGRYINEGAIWLTRIIWVKIIGMTDEDQISRLTADITQFWDHYLFWVGFLLAVFGVYVFGRFLTSYFGRYLYRAAERGIIQLPVIKQIYPSVKQVTDFLLTERKMEYSKVVAVEYPRKDIWSIGLVTSSGMRTINETVGSDLLTIFIPSSPTPVTGYTITVRREDVIDLPISIDEALRFTISGGVIQPSNQKADKLPVISSKLQSLTGSEDKESAK